jgi:hypothetical protein
MKPCRCKTSDDMRLSGRRFVWSVVRRPAPSEVGVEQPARLVEESRTIAMTSGVPILALIDSPLEFGSPLVPEVGPVDHEPPRLERPERREGGPH